MKIDVIKVLSEIDRLEKKLKKALKEKIDFEETHEEVRNLCEIIFSKKSIYKSIDIEYPVVIEGFDYISPTNGGVTRKEVPGAKEVKPELAKEELAILKKAKSIFSLRFKLQSKKDSFSK